MATQAYWTWRSAGRPYELAQPIQELKDWADRNGIPWLGDIGNEEHLQAERPQDHTPFSRTAWPFGLPGYIVTACDMANVNGLGQAIEDQARAGELPWLKYMNHSGQHLDSRDLDGDGLTWEEYPSSDKHVHLSIRTDWIYRSIGIFNPFKGVDMSGPLFLKVKNEPGHNRPDIYSSDGLNSRKIPGRAAPAIERLVTARKIEIFECDDLEQLFALGGPLKADDPLDIQFTEAQLLQLSDQAAAATVERLGALQFVGQPK